MNMSQPAVSHALTRLRALFADPLLVRADGGLQLTARARELQPLLAEVIRLSGSLVGRNSFDPEQAERVFRLGMSDYGALVVLPDLVRRLRVEAPGIALRTGRYRWKICALLFFAATINYMDRQVLGVLAPELQRSIGWNEAQYGYIVTAFQTAYAIAYLFAGRMMDWLGVRIGYGIAIAFWSLAAMAHSLAHSAFTFGAGNGAFPAVVAA